VAPIAPAVLGTVRDSAGTPLPNARVIIATLKRSAMSDGEGHFVFRGLPPGHHHLDAVLIGFARSEADVDVPESGADVKVDIVLRPSAVRLSDVVISAKPTGGDALGITQSTVDMSGKDLGAALATSIAQTLEREPGMAMRYNGPAATLPVIRGLTGERILVLQDGERSGDLSSAAPDHGLTIDPLSADRIEVVRGPASLLYGTAALGGVVNVISNDIPTSVPSHISGFLAGQGESVHPGGAGTGSLTLPLGSAGAFTLGGGLRNAQSVKMGGGELLQNSDARDNHEHAGLGLIGDKGSFGVSYRRYKFTYGLPGEAGDPELGGKIDGLRNEGSLRADLSGGSKAFRGLSVTGTAQTYKHDELENTGAVGTAFNLKTQTGNITAKSAFGAVEGALGVSGLFKQYASTGAEALTPAADSKSFGGFLFEQVPLGRMREHGANLQLGARFDSYNIDSKAGDPKFGPATSLTFNAFSGSVGVTLPIGTQASFAVNAARAFRAPTVEELFSNAFHAAEGAFDVGNPDLKPETNNGIEGVYRVQSPRVTGQFSAYYNRIDKYIVPDIRGDTLVDGETVPLNHFSQSNATLRGAEASLEAEVAPHIVIGGQGDFVRASLAGGGNVPFIPPARVAAHARWDNGHFSVGGEVRHGLKQDKVSGGDLDVPTDAYTLLNFNAGWSMIANGLVHQLTLRVDNATDQEYRDATSFIKRFAFNPGRNVALVYKVLF
jgi:iron complex outermembrane receptor protein